MGTSSRVLWITAAADQWEKPLDSEWFDGKAGAGIANAVRVALDVFEGRTRWRGRPFHVEVSTNNACNLTCVMCERPDIAWIRAQELDRVAGQIFPSATILTPSATSEPAMGDFDRIMDFCDQNDLRLNLITNGNLITDRHVERLRGRIFRTDFSIDSHVPSVYERIRRGGRHERMLAGLRRLVRLQQAEGFPLTLIVVLMSENLQSLPGLFAFARAEGVLRVRVQRMLPFFADPARLDPREHFTAAEIARTLEAAEAAAAREGVQVQWDLPGRAQISGAGVTDPEVTSPRIIHAFFEALAERRPGLCFQLMTYLRVIPTGAAYPCCRGWDDELRMGSVNDDSIEDIWNGPEYARLRAEFRDGNLREICARCTLSGQGAL